MSLVSNSFFSRRSLILSVCFLIATIYISYQANGHSGGMTGRTRKAGDSPGCTCHCASANANTTVTISTTAVSIVAGQTYTFTAKVTNTGEVKAGVDISCNNGTLAVSTGGGLQSLSGQLTHTGPMTLPATFTFKYTAPASPGWDTIYATGNAVNNDGSNGGGNCTDEWNFAPNYAVNVVAPPSKKISLSKSSIAFGSVRVGKTSKDVETISSNGDTTLTIASTTFSKGLYFSNSKTGTNRAIPTGSNENDSIAFTPTAKGIWSDSLIINSDATTSGDNRKTVYLSGTGTQGVFSGGATLAFGNLRINTTKKLGYVFTNTGDDSLFLQTPTVSGSGFSIVTQPTKLNLAAGEKDSVVVQFAPTAKLPYAGSVHFTAQPGVTTPTITLSGQGTAPQISVAPFVSIGSVHAGSLLAGLVTISNAGTDTLHLTSATLANPPGKFSITGFSNAIAPGASGTVQINYASTTETRDTIVLTIGTDDPTTPSATIHVTASAVLPHIAVPADTVNFGAVRVGGTPVLRDIEIDDHGGEDVIITNLTAGPFPFILKTSVTHVGNGSSAFATVSFQPTAKGNFTGQMIVSSNDPAHPSDTVNLKGSGINSALNVPGNLDFGIQKINTSVTKSVTLQNTGNAPVTIRYYKLLDVSGAFGLPDTSIHSLNGGQNGTISVSFKPAVGSPYNATLELHTDDADAPVRTITITGHGSTGKLALSQDLIDFGTVDTGTSHSIQVMLRNTGNAAITVSAMNIAGSPGFSSDWSGSKSIAPNDSLPVQFTYHPLVAGQDTATSTFTFESGSLVLGLKGSARTPLAVMTSNLITEPTLQVRPNPSISHVSINFTLKTQEQIELSLYDLSGNLVRLISSGDLEAGAHSEDIDASQLASGSYFLKLTTRSGKAWTSKVLIEH